MSNDLAYANRDFIPDADGYIDRWEDAAEAHRSIEKDLGRAWLNRSYGPGDRLAYDLFYPSSARPDGLVMFVHGGYWRMFDRSYWSHLAVGPTQAGWAVAMPSYDLCPAVSIAQITVQISQALQHAAAAVSGPIRLLGHSAGGHLVARMICADVGLPQEVLERIEHVLPISPVSDLRPLIDTKMNDDFRLDDALARAESPALMRPADIPTTVWVGAEERPAFLDQARWLAEAWDNATLRIDPGRHHFDVIEGLEDADSPLMRALLI